jgi:hypothetical protein
MPGEFIARQGLISRGNVVVTGSLTTSGSLTTTGTITATTLVVQTITSSISSITGSTNFGSLSSNTHTFTGSINTSGSGNFSGSLTVGGFGSNIFSAGGTGYNRLKLINTTAGVANGSQLSVGVDTDPDQLYIQSFSSTFTTSGMNVAAGAVINGEGAGGLNLAATQANIGFYTNGSATSNLRMFISSSGNVGIGTSSPSDILDVQKNQNATTNVYFRNTNNTDANSRMYLNLVAGNASAGIAVLAGGSGTGSLYIGGVTNGDIYFQPYLGGTVTMMLKSSGNVGIGSSTANYTLDVNKSVAGDFITRILNSSSTGYGLYIQTNDNSKPAIRVANATGVTGIDIGADPNYAGYSAIGWGNLANGYAKIFSSNTNADALYVCSGTSQGVTFRVNGTTESVKFTSGGVILMNQAGGAYGSETLEITSKLSGATQYGILVSGNPASYTNVAMRFHHTGVTVVGSISFTTTTTTYGTSSDYRLKKDLKDFNALNVLSNIKLYDFAWKLNDSRMYGVMAHELKEVLPYAVTGEKDKLDENGNISPQGVDYSLITPVLVKAIQELTARVQYLENK